MENGISIKIVPDIKGCSRTVELVTIKVITNREYTNPAIGNPITSITNFVSESIEKVIPDLRDRITLELIGTPLTHSHFLRRHQGTYGPAIVAGKGMFPSCHTPISGLYRVGDSTTPGIGVPAVAASGILCANTLVSPQQTWELLQVLV